MRLFRALFLCAAFAAPALVSSAAQADGCYICSGGSAAQCKDYCRYTGSDTFEARKKCEKAGCKIGGTASCPTAVNYKVCSAALSVPAPSNAQYAAVPWCAPKDAG